jgi:hypothetical protein
MLLRSALPLLCCAAASAQWFKVPTPGVPRNPDGSPNLSAPAPRAPDGRPDLSGMWLPAEHLPCPPILRNADGSCLEMTPLAPHTRDFAAGLPDGPPYQPWAAELVRQRIAASGKDDPHAACMPPYYPRSYVLPHIQKFIQIPGELVILNEFNAGYRQIFTDGRPLPEDPQPSWNGYSVAQWEEDTLVVKTTGFRDDLWLDMRGNPLTEAATVFERLRRPSFGTMEVEVTIDDPKAYTRPWTAKFALEFVADTELIDEICLENEKSRQHMPK